MKQIGILGVSGEIGKRTLNILKKEYNILGSYRTREQQTEKNCRFIKLDIDNEVALADFCQQSDVLINCAGASYVNGEKIAKIAAQLQVPFVDPSGESFLEEKIDSVKNQNIFVLSSGYFPGMTGLLMRFLCQSFDAPHELCGLSIAEEIPSRSAIEDFILTNIAGFGVALNYFENERLQRDDTEKFEIIKNKEYTFQNYYTVELDRLVKAFHLKKANWYNHSFGNNITQKMQKAVIIFGQKGRSEEYTEVIDEIIEIFAKNSKNKSPFSFMRLQTKGISSNKKILKKIEIKSKYSSEISAVIAAYTAKTILDTDLKNGIYYAMDVIDASSLLKVLPNFGIEVNMFEKEIQKENKQSEEYIEGEI